MISQAIAFTIPAKFELAHAAGEVVRYGALLKDSGTGQIVAHLQETGAVQSLISGAGLGPFFAATGVATVVQNHQISRTLEVMQGTLAGIQGLQLASLVASGVGIGVTVASTMVILKRIETLGGNLKSIEEKIDRLPDAWRDMMIGETLGKLETQLARLDEAEARQTPDPVVQAAEAVFHDGFDTLYRNAVQIVKAPTIDPELLHTVLLGLATCSAAGTKALFWLDDTMTAAKRGRVQFDKLQQLSLALPPDQFIRKAGVRLDEAQPILGTLTEMRQQAATLPMLGERLSDSGIHGRAYLDHASGERDAPVLLLAAT